MPATVCAAHLDQPVRPGRGCPLCAAERQPGRTSPGDRPPGWTPLHRGPAATRRIKGRR